MTVKIEVFTSPTCPHCPSAVMLAQNVAKERADVKVVISSTATSEGSKRARLMDVMTVPTIFVKGSEFDRIGFRGTPPKSKLLDAVDISLGIKSWPDKSDSKSFLQKIRERYL